MASAKMKKLRAEGSVEGNWKFRCVRVETVSKRHLSGSYTSFRHVLEYEFKEGDKVHTSTLYIPFPRRLYKEGDEAPISLLLQPTLRRGETDGEFIGEKR